MAQNRDTENGSELKVPNWLTREYFTDILNDEFGDGKYAVKTFKIENAVGKGENFTSVLLRVIINVELKGSNDQTISYIIKSMDHSNEMNVMWENEGNIFTKEVDLLSVTVPKFEKLYEDAHDNDCLDIQLGPRCLKSRSDGFIMEDLRSKGFKNMCRTEGLDAQHVRFALIKLANFHAASVVLYDREGPYANPFAGKTATEKFLQFVDKHAQLNRKNFLSFVKKWNLDTEILDKMDSAHENLPKKLLSVYPITTADPNEFMVLNHADFWINNIMFQHNGNTIKDMIFIDFQMCRWGSPALDLYYFLISSVCDQIKIQNFDYHIKIYHDELVKSFKLLNYVKPIPSLVDLHCLLLKKGFWAYQCCTILMHVKNDSVIRNEEDDENSYKRKLYANPKYMKAMKQLLPFLNNRGAFEAY